MLKHVDCQGRFSRAFLCVTQRGRGGGPVTPDVTQPVLSLSESLLRSHWTLLTCIPFEVSIKHAPTHENTSKLVLLNHFTSEASPCWSPMGISTLQCIMSNLLNVKYCLPMLYFYYVGRMNTTVSLVTKQTCLFISTDHCSLMTGI